jgi:hypothetical protein
VSNRTPPIVVISDFWLGNAISVTFWMCEQAVRTCKAVATVVFGVNWIVIHCWLRAASIFAQPVSTTATAAGTAMRALHRRSRSRTPTLYGLGPDDWLTGL